MLVEQFPLCFRQSEEVIDEEVIDSGKKPEKIAKGIFDIEIYEEPYSRDYQNFFRIVLIFSP